MKRILLLFALLGTIHAAAAQPFRVFLSPEGDDSRDGLASDRSVLSLARAHEIIVRELTREPKDAEVRIAQGLYAGQVVKWTFFMPDHTITFLPAGDDKDNKDRPVFDGGGTGIWFSFHVDANGARTNLIFQNLKVQNYQTAIGFDGYRTHEKSSSRGNTIDGCYFTHIGEGATAAVRFTNSSGNRVVNSSFVFITRSSSRGLLHAIYIAHTSVENQILQNRFMNCCGDVIRLRDASNNNVVQGNHFVQAGELAAISDWFCDHEAESDCTKPTAECPSWNNIVKDNVLDRNFAGKPLEATFVYSNHLPTGCSNPSPEAQRFVVSGNQGPGNQGTP